MFKHLSIIKTFIALIYNKCHIIFLKKFIQEVLEHVQHYDIYVRPTNLADIFYTFFFAGML